MKDNPIQRRDFLKMTLDSLLVFGGLVGLGGLIRYLGYQTEPPKPTEYDLGPAENYLPGSKTVLPQVPAVLIRSDNGFEAISLVCTHLGCTVDVETNGFACPCHGSQFNVDGVPTKGPAASPLQQLRLEQTSDGKLILHTN
jgi:cytochrome b6-f complex iron-sulfur subunit